MEYYFNFFYDSDILNIALKCPVKHVWTVMCAFTGVINVLVVKTMLRRLLRRFEGLWDS